MWIKTPFSKVSPVDWSLCVVLRFAFQSPPGGVSNWLVPRRPIIKKSVLTRWGNHTGVSMIHGISFEYICGKAGISYSLLVYQYHSISWYLMYFRVSVCICMQHSLRKHGLLPRWDNPEEYARWCYMFLMLCHDFSQVSIQLNSQKLCRISAIPADLIVGCPCCNAFTFHILTDFTWVHTIGLEGRHHRQLSQHHNMTYKTSL